ISPPSPTKPSQQGYSSIIDDDLCEIRISPTTNSSIRDVITTSNIRQSTSRQSALDAVTTKLPANVRKKFNHSNNITTRSATTSITG
ncbi:unnamed protein product, partial [Rotaria socialis]